MLPLDLVRLIASSLSAGVNHFLLVSGLKMESKSLVGLGSGEKRTLYYLAYISGKTRKLNKPIAMVGVASVMNSHLHCSKESEG